MFTAKVRRGANKGKTLYPHRYEDGTFVLSKDRFERNYVRVSSDDEIKRLLDQGLSLRMSNPAEGIHSPSLISPAQVDHVAHANRFERHASAVSASRAPTSTRVPGLLPATLKIILAIGVLALLVRAFGPA